MADLQVEEERKEETEEEGGGEGTHLVFHPLPQQTCKQCEEVINQGINKTLCHYEISALNDCGFLSKSDDPFCPMTAEPLQL